MGRHSTFSDEIAEAICKRLADGEGLRGICSDKGMPPRNTVLGWLECNADFRAKYARAREHQADVMDELILNVANACSHESALADRVKIAAYQWRASKLKPKVYGDKTIIGGEGADGAIVTEIRYAWTKDEPA